MYRQESKRNIRKTAFSIDMINIVVGLVIVLLAAVSFFNPEDHMLLLPVIFLLGAVLNLINGVYGFSRSQRDMKKKVGAIVQCTGGILLLGIFALSSFSIWWG